MSTPNPTAPFNVRLELSEDGRHVRAVVEPRADAVAPNADDLHAMLREQGWDQWFVDKDALGKLPRLARDAKAPTRIDLAEKRNAEVSVHVAKDEMSAHLSIVPARGGDPVTAQDVRVMIERHGIKHGLLTETIDAAVAAQSAENILIAEGTPATPGEDTVFEKLLPEISDRRPKVREDGTVDYREINAFFTVTPDTPLMRRVAPTPGTAGTTVTAKVVPAKPGRDIPYAPALAGTKYHESDRNVLVAAIGGQPVLIDHGVRVEPVLTLPAVDLSTGNIEFNGTLNVKGDVGAGLRVRTTGDVCVTGMVEGAIIEAGGNVDIAKGIIGRGDLHNADGTPGATIARIKARGNVHARFIENAVVEADGDVLVDELVAHCEVSAQGAVAVGKPKGKKGHILGGSIIAVKGVKALVLGSASGVRTRIEAGLSRSVRAAIDQAREALIRKCAERDKLTTLLTRTGQIPKALIERAKATLLQTESDIQALNDERDKLQQTLAQDVSARISVGVATHEGITIQLGDSTLTTTKDYGPGQFSLNEQEIVYTPQ